MESGEWCSMQASPKLTISEEEAKALTARIQDAGTEVVKAKVILPHPESQPPRPSAATSCPHIAQIKHSHICLLLAGFVSDPLLRYEEFTQQVLDELYSSFLLRGTVEDGKYMLTT
jgi:hypothetical protein